MVVVGMRLVKQHAHQEWLLRQVALHRGPAHAWQACVACAVQALVTGPTCVQWHILLQPVPQHLGEGGLGLLCVRCQHGAQGLVVACSCQGSRQQPGALLAQVPAPSQSQQCTWLLMNLSGQSTCSTVCLMSDAGDS